MLEQDGNTPENFFDIEKIHHVYSFKLMVDGWREAVTSDPEHWYDRWGRRMIRDLPEAERVGYVVDNPTIHIDKRPWEQVPRRIQDVLRAAYDCASHDIDSQKAVSLTIGSSDINFELHSPSLQGGLTFRDLYGENYVSRVDFQLEDTPSEQYWKIEPYKREAGLWGFNKWSFAQDEKEKAIRRKVREEDVELTFEERLILSVQRAKIVRCTLAEIEDLAEFLEGATPHAIVWCTNAQTFPQVANPPWIDNPPTIPVTLDKKGRLSFGPYDENGETIERFHPEDFSSEEQEQFRRLALEALRQLITDDTQSALWERFRFTYEARRQFQWLGEFGHDGDKKMFRGKQPTPISNPIMGIAAGLLSSFHYFNEEETQEFIEKNEQGGMRTDLDDSFRDSLLKAVDLLEQTPESRLKDIIFLRLLGHNIDITKLTTEEITQGLKRGVSRYWEQTYGSGYGDPGPW